MLAEIQLGGVKPEDGDLLAQGAEFAVGQGGRAILFQAFDHHVQRFRQDGRGEGMEVASGVFGQEIDRVFLVGIGQFGAEAGEQEPIRFVGIPVGKGVEMLGEMGVLFQERLQPGGDAVSAQGNAQKARERQCRIAEFGQGQAAVQHQAFRGDLGGDIGIAVPVAADPGSERQPAVGRLDFGIIPGQRAFQVGLQFRNGVPQGGVEIPEAGAHFVSDLGADGPAPVREPQGGDLPLEIFFVGDGKRARFGRGAVPKHRGQALEFCEEGTAFGFRRMRREDQLDRHLIQKMLQIFCADAALFEFGNGRFDRFARGNGRGIVFLCEALGAPVAQQMHAMVFLGQIDELEVGREGHGHFVGFVRLESGDGLAEFFLGIGIPVAPGLGQLPEGFDRLKNFRSFQLLNHMAESGAQAADFPGKAFKFGGLAGHAPLM
jgi:hypothetical protein